MSVDAYVDWPSAPLTKKLVLQALDQTLSYTLKDSTSANSTRPTLQWSTYDSIDHEKTLECSGTVLASSYTIRKALIRKHFLHRCIEAYTTKNPRSPLLDCVPRTWDIEISYADELDDSGSLWIDELYELSEEFQKNPEKWWIVKPGMADRGMGIRIFNDKASLQRIFEEFENEDEDDDEDATNIVISQLRHFVIQEYLQHPVLLNPSEKFAGPRSPPKTGQSSQGHKFHLRAYCVASGALQVYLYRHVLALFSAVPYTPLACSSGGDVLDLRPHLTNTCLQGVSRDENVMLLQELVGLTIHDHPHNNRGSPSFTDSDLDSIMQQMATTLAETFQAALQMPVHFQPLPNAFELYGVDFLVCHDGEKSVGEPRFKVKLLEINAEPAIEMTGERLRWILSDLFEAIGIVCVKPFFPTGQFGRDGVSVSCSEKGELLHKCLDVSMHMRPSPSRSRSSNLEDRTQIFKVSTFFIPFSISSGIDVYFFVSYEKMPWQSEIRLPRRSKGCHLITQDILNHIGPALENVKVGILYLFVKHTSCAITVNENYDPDVRTDMDMALDHVVPEELKWLHTDEGPDDSVSHTKAALVGPSVQIPITDGCLNLGTWQGESS